LIFTDFWGQIATALATARGDLSCHYEEQSDEVIFHRLPRLKPRGDKTGGIATPSAAARSDGVGVSEPRKDGVAAQSVKPSNQSLALIQRMPLYCLSGSSSSVKRYFG